MGAVVELVKKPPEGFNCDVYTTFVIKRRSKTKKDSHCFLAPETLGRTDDFRAPRACFLFRLLRLTVAQFQPSPPVRAIFKASKCPGSSRAKGPLSASVIQTWDFSSYDASKTNISVSVNARASFVASFAPILLSSTCDVALLRRLLLPIIAHFHPRTHTQTQRLMVFELQACLIL